MMMDLSSLDTVFDIEQGRPPPPDPPKPDDVRTAARCLLPMLLTIPGVTTADTLTGTQGGGG